MHSPTTSSKTMKPRNILGFIAGLATFAFAYGCHAASGQSTSISNTQNSEVHNSSQGASQTELAREWGLTPKNGPVSNCDGGITDCHREAETAKAHRG